MKHRNANPALNHRAMNNGTLAGDNRYLVLCKLNLSINVIDQANRTPSHMVLSVIARCFSAGKTNLQGFR
jgi:hypothetical protein